ncbi:MAG: hypothetical protein QOJ72_1848 [Nocardioidaceae bacterium]|nr:hypothetical protein [Nocardioidaceae bacterium]
MSSSPQSPSPPTPARLPGRTGFSIAAVLAVIAIAVAATVAIVIVRAMVGYSITPFGFDEQRTVTVHDRPVALWMTPESAGANCLAINTETQQQSAHRGTADTVTITDGGHTWMRLGLIEGPPGSTYTVTCSPYGNAAPPELVGYAPNPRFSRYIALGVIGGGVAGLTAIGSVVLIIVTAVRRSSAKKARNAATA